MTTFLDGPAADVALDLRRAPLFLRVCRNRRTLEWDALDKLVDTPKASEDLHCYYRITPANRWVHMRPGGYFALAEYRLFPEQPAEAVMRNTGPWRAWCVNNAAKATMLGRQPNDTANTKG